MKQHSVRKSYLDALIGIHVAKGEIRLSDSLGDLGIDDTAPSLTPAEKGARVIDLLMSKSGISHVSNYETDSEKELRPRRGSHLPGSFWYYNNWDFNALGTVFRKQTKIGVFKAFAEEIAAPPPARGSDTVFCGGPPPTAFFSGRKSAPARTAPRATAAT